MGGGISLEGFDFGPYLVDGRQGVASNGGGGSNGLISRNHWSSNTTSGFFQRQRSKKLKRIFERS